jgi:hypothetical protein
MRDMVNRDVVKRDVVKRDMMVRNSKHLPHGESWGER